MSFRMRTAVLSMALTLVLAPTFAHAQIDEPRIPLQTKLTELTRFRTEYAENFNKHDAAAVAAMYAPDAILIARTGQVFSGRDQIAHYMTNGTREIPHIIIASDSMVVYGNTAVDTGKLTQHPAAGGELVSHYMVVLRRDMKGWKIMRVSDTPVMPENH